MKKVIFAKSSDIKGRKATGCEDCGGFNNWRKTYGDCGQDSVN